MSISKEEMLKRSAELLDSYLDTVSAEEFAVMHESVKVDNGITIEDYFGKPVQTFNFMVDGTNEPHKAMIITPSEEFPIHLQFAGFTSSCSSECANDDEYIGRAA